ncbi:Permeases of the major facilitator superfamily [[Actinomadura] parvosata subsp. kistnae]|uniref:MFS transporter n=1 Tax=[Actinomadura] parvosata subsp. kistnae TaxID=1909395 RepID=A0A1V0A2K2_9ACTN|nr:MFS transporter [Nonomuraea sp. ATCC 55076]AQZ64451.1 MFS transporter [Nonomuraea sp. ATCC 55076]SPL89250.1 Permeases of the major facilitator superfamily [Actinomadura parvosata subsp. kistnae]
MSEPTSAQHKAQVRKAATASVVGTAIEWYDFFLYNTAAAVVFAEVFFPESTPYAGTLAAFATNFVGFAARPVGAAIFGHWGDRIGRKATLIVTLLLMGVASALIGVLPGTASIGVAAPIILVVLRIVQGIAVGGEWSGSVLLSMEWGDQRRRGLMASWPQVGVPIGLILGTGAMSLLAATAGDAFRDWGWRVPFLASLVLVAVGLWVRLKVLETPMFARVVERGDVVRLPVFEVIRRHPKEVVLSALLRMSEQMPFYLFTTFAIAYLTQQLHLPRTVALAAVTCAAAVELVAIPFFGHLSDRVGRRLVYAAGAALLAVVAFPYFLLLNTGIVAVVFATVIVTQIQHSMEYGPQASLIAESFPTSLRYGGAGLGYQLASVVAGGPAPLIATWLLHDYGWQAIAVFMVAGAVVGFAATLALPDRSKIDISEHAAYGRP